MKKKKCWSREVGCEETIWMKCHVDFCKKIRKILYNVACTFNLESARVYTQYSVQVQDKNGILIIFFLSLHKNTCCGYSLEVPQCMFYSVLSGAMIPFILWHSCIQNTCNGKNLIKCSKISEFHHLKVTFDFLCTKKKKKQKKQKENIWLNGFFVLTWLIV